jgi:hypothetical protein
MVCEQAAGLSIDLDCAPQEVAMPRYYFDVREGETFAPDEDGVEFHDLDTAEYEAACMAAEIGRERLPVGDTRDVTIEVRDEHGRHLLAVTVSMRINRVERGNECEQPNHFDLHVRGLRILPRPYPRQDEREPMARTVRVPERALIHDVGFMPSLGR